MFVDAENVIAEKLPSMLGVGVGVAAAPRET
jgi:hypothetical protein